MAARKNRIAIDENTRKKIQASQLINKLTNHVLNDTEMTATQVNAALGLLKKTLPDLKVQEIDMKTTEMTYEQWLESIDDTSSN